MVRPYSGLPLYLPLTCPPLNMPSNQRESASNTLYLLALLSAAIAFILGVFFVLLTPPEITANSPLIDRLIALFLSCAPNIISALTVFVVVYVFLQVRGISTAFTSDSNIQKLADEVLNRVNNKLRQQSLSDADIQKIVRDVSNSQSRSVSLSNAQVQKLAKELAPDLADQVKQISISDVALRKMVEELHVLLRSQYNLEEQARRVSLLQELFRRQIDHLFLMTSNFRGELFKRYYSAIVPTNANDATHFKMGDSDYSLFQNICRYITDGVRDSLLEHFRIRNIDIGEDIAVTVKLIIDADQLAQLSSLPRIDEAKIKQKQRWIITVFRDSYTYRHYREKREVGGIRVYDIPSNTGFRNIHENGNEYFVNNDLEALSRSGAYVNENPDWRTYYNATIIVPIEYRDVQAGRICYGFLAADSLNTIKNAHLFDSVECLSIMRQAAELLTIYFLLLVLVNVEPSAQ